VRVGYVGPVPDDRAVLTNPGASLRELAGNKTALSGFIGAWKKHSRI
jgi:hypothetical protein